MGRRVFKAVFTIGIIILVIGCQDVNSGTPTYTIAKNPLIGTWESKGYIDALINSEEDSKYAHELIRVTFLPTGKYEVYQDVQTSEDTDSLPVGIRSYVASYQVDGNYFYLFQYQSYTFDECIKENVLTISDPPLYKQ